MAIKTPKIRKNFNLSLGEVRALELLVKAGYNFTEADVVRRAIRDAWEKEFPGRPFPDNEKAERSP